MIEPIKGWREGQTLFNFLWWLNIEKGIPREPLSTESRMADVFSIEDEELERYWQEFKKVKT